MLVISVVFLCDVFSFVFFLELGDCDLVLHIFQVLLAQSS